MSHLSQIKTSIYNLDILKTTLNRLGFQYSSKLCSKSDMHMYQGIDLLVFEDSTVINPICGFMYNGKEYILVTDIFFWKLDLDINSFVDKLKQAYALNVILDTANRDGFEMISQTYEIDGSIELVVQKWNS